MAIGKNALGRRLIFAVRIAALILVIASIAMSLRSNAVDEEWAFTSPHVRWEFVSSAGALQISRLHHYTGTAQEMVPRPFVTAFPFPEKFVGAECGFATRGWSYAQDRAVPHIIDPFIPRYVTTSFPYHDVPTTPEPGKVYFVPLSAPVPIGFNTGVTFVIPYWFLMLLGMISLFRVLLRAGSQTLGAITFTRAKKLS